MNLYLIGFRGAGKSTIGPVLADRLGLEFVDLDALIEERTGGEIPDLFAEGGEPVFRRLEEEAFTSLAGRTGLVVALGGGAVLSSAVRRVIACAESAVWLRAEPEVIYSRIRGSNRPSLTGSDPAAEAEEIMRQREPLYNSCAKLQVDTGETTIEETVHVIERFWETLPSRQLR